MQPPPKLCLSGVLPSPHLSLQPCRMAADPSSALLLEPTCQAVSDWNHYIAASILGPMLLWLTSGSSTTNAAACKGMAMAAKTLGWYTHASYGVLLLAAGFCALEWRLKARWVREKLGKQLVYGPLGWPRSECQLSTFASHLQHGLNWILVTAAGLGLLWVIFTWLVPLMPPSFGGIVLCGGRTCVDKGTCRSVACGECRQLACAGVAALRDSSAPCTLVLGANHVLPEMLQWSQGSIACRAVRRLTACVP